MIRVIKIGGSLLTLPDWHERFLRWLATERPAMNLLLIGGGELVDVLRREHERYPYTEQQMHLAALAAMEIHAQLALARLPLAKEVDCPALIQQFNAADIGRTRMATSSIFVVRIANWWRAAAGAGRVMPPETWDTTSDTLAASIAGSVSAAELVLLKSTDPPRSEEDWTPHGYVDPNFFYHLSQGIPCRAVNLRTLQLNRSVC